MPPALPELALASRLVRIILEVEVDSAGVVNHVSVLDEGDASVAALIQSAVKTWRFQPIRSVLRGINEGVRIGRLIFYAKETGGSTILVDAAAERLAEERKKRAALK